MNYVLFLLLCLRVPLFHANALSHGRKPSCTWNGGDSKDVTWKLRLNKPHAVAVPRLLSSYVDKVKGVATFHRQLGNVPVYIVTDVHGNPIISHYPTKKSGSDVAPTSVSAIKAEVRATPDATQLADEFMNLFKGEKNISDSYILDLTKLGGGMPQVMLYFMDPNACSAHIMELRRQGKEAYMGVTKLDDFIRQCDSKKQQHEHILLPLAESLTEATNYGKDVFKGTPVFTTDPPIVKTMDENGDQAFNPRTDKFVVFFTPDEAASFFRKAWWTRKTTVYNNGKKEHYKIIGSYTSPSPTIRCTSIERLWRLINSSEPYWGILLHLIPPDVKLDSDTTRLKGEYESRNTFPVRMMNKLLLFFR